MKVEKPINDGSVIIAYLHTNFNSKSKSLPIKKKKKKQEPLTLFKRKFLSVQCWSKDSKLQSILYVTVESYECIKGRDQVRRGNTLLNLEHCFLFSCEGGPMLVPPLSPLSCERREALNYLITFRFEIPLNFLYHKIKFASKSQEHYSLNQQKHGRSQRQRHFQFRSFEARWHVFLSFRGKDTCYRFINNLYTSFHNKGIRAFRDDNGLRRGDEIAQTLLDAIEESVASIVIISQNYVPSRWCLQELSKICECKRLTLLVFHQVDPSDFRKQRGPFFGKHFMEHEEKVIEKKLRRKG